MKKLISLLVVLCLTFSCAAALADEVKTIKVGASPSPHAEILEIAKPVVESLGYKLEIVELNAELIPGARADVAYAVINGNNATLVELVPYVDGLYAEQPGSLAAESYVNIVVVKPENAEAQWVKDLADVIYTQEVYDLIVNAGFAPTFEVK